MKKATAAIITIIGVIIVSIMLISMLTISTAKGALKPTEPLFIIFPLHNTEEIIGIPTKKNQHPNFMLFYQGESIFLFLFKKETWLTEFTEHELFMNIEFRKGEFHCADHWFNTMLKQAGAAQDTSSYKLKDLSMSFLDPNNAIFRPRKPDEIRIPEGINVNPRKRYTPNIALLAFSTDYISSKPRATPFIMQKKGDQNQVGVFLDYGDHGEVWQIIGGKLKFYRLNKKQHYTVLKMIKEYIVRAIGQP